MVDLNYLTNGSVLLVDGSNLLIRIFYSKKKDNVLLTELEMRESCCTIFMHQLGLYCKKYNCNRLYVAFDLGGSIRKRQIYSEYKANRSHTVTLTEGITEQTTAVDQSLIEYLELRDSVVALLKAFNIPVYMEAGIEADDMIGIAAEMLQNMNQNVIILSNDTDFLQLVAHPQVVQSLPMKNLDVCYKTFTEFFTSYKKVSILPREYVFYKSVIGDSTDNINGVKGIAYKKLHTLLESYLESDQHAASAYCSDFHAFLDYVLADTSTHKLVDVIKNNIDLIKRNMKLISLSTDYMSGQAVRTTAAILKEVSTKPLEVSIMKEYLQLFKKAPSFIFISDTLFSLRSIWK